METLQVKQLDPFKDEQIVKDFFQKHNQCLGDLFRCKSMRDERDLWLAGYVGEELRGLMFFITLGFPHHQVHINTAPNFRCKYLRKFVQQCFERFLCAERIKGLAVGLCEPHYRWLKRVCTRYGFTFHPKALQGGYDLMMLEF